MMLSAEVPPGNDGGGSARRCDKVGESHPVSAMIENYSMIELSGEDPAGDDDHQWAARWVVRRCWHMDVMSNSTRKAAVEEPMVTTRSRQRDMTQWSIVIANLQTDGSTADTPSSISKGKGLMAESPIFITRLKGRFEPSNFMTMARRPFFISELHGYGARA
ncbi:hypothetical protein Dimus_036470, partial [Dionaea muscipula]